MLDNRAWYEDFRQHPVPPRNPSVDARVPQHQMQGQGSTQADQPQGQQTLAKQGARTLAIT
jgi:hypothetical protein